MKNETKPDQLAFFEYVALNKLEGKEFRLSYAMQRKFFGYVPFGKKRISTIGNKVQVLWKVSYGTDWETLAFWWSQEFKAWRDCLGNNKGQIIFHQ